MVIDLTINSTSGPRTLARGGLGWGPLYVAIALQVGRMVINLTINSTSGPLPLARGGDRRITINVKNLPL